MQIKLFILSCAKIKLLQPQIDYFLLCLRRQRTVMRASVLVEIMRIGVCV